MRWEDERYVRVYTRDTGDWLALGWQAQAMFLLLLRKADRAGILSTGRGGVRGLAALAGMPVDVAQEATALLIEDGCLRTCDGGYIIPNFISAQEARSSDKARQQKLRETARDIAASHVVTVRDESSQIVTGRHTTSHDVTNGHAESHRVTPSLAVPSRTVPSFAGSATASPQAPLFEEPAKTPKPKKPKPEPTGDPRHKPLMDAMSAAYGEVLQGQKWDLAGNMGGREAKAVKELLAKADADPRTAGDGAASEIVRRWRFALGDPFSRTRYAHLLADRWGQYDTPRQQGNAVANARAPIRAESQPQYDPSKPAVTVLSGRDAFKEWT